MQETQVRSLDQEDPLEKEMATHSSSLTWEIPWAKESGVLQSMWSQKVRNNWSDLAHIEVKWSRSVVSNSVTQRTVAHQVPLSMGFSRQEY